MTNTEAFDRIVESVDTSLVVVTAAADGTRAGCLVGFHAQSSIDPQRYSVWLSKANHTYPVAIAATHLGIHFLTAEDLAIAKLFGTVSGDAVDKFDGLPVSTGLGGVPLLDNCPHRLTLRRTAIMDEGSDHVCLEGEAVAAQSDGRFEPFRLSRAHDLKPGHDADEHAGTAATTPDQVGGRQFGALFRDLADSLLLATDMPIDDLHETVALVSRRLRAFADVVESTDPVS
jgi:flavin reductase (DIM6/NTAB) family NADH-FMN oxidoreductase RutF